MPFFAIADCDNFFCSCERVFRPDLLDKPVVVLSNNDGCIIARSQESKALGIKMGEPFFKAKALIERHKIAVFSGNYILYGDMSRRVMSLLSAYTPHLEVYSIDEAFLDLTGVDTPSRLPSYCKDMVRYIHKGTGIPISIGIAPTKTLAKLAVNFAKKYKGYEKVCMIDTEEKREKALRLSDISDVWGIGRRSIKRLLYHGVRTAWDLTERSEAWIRRELTISGVRVWRELRGESCIHTSEVPHKKSICTSRSFSDEGLERVEELEEALAGFAATCAQKLKTQQSVCRAITIFAHTSRFRQDIRQDYIHHTILLDIPTNNTQEIISNVIRALRSEWRNRKFFYKRAGVIVWDLHHASGVQYSLFDTEDRARQKALAQAIEEINRKGGHNTIRVAIQGNRAKLFYKQEHRSKQFTTNLDEIIVLNLKD